MFCNFFIRSKTSIDFYMRFDLLYENYLLFNHSSKRFNLNKFLNLVFYCIINRKYSSRPAIMMNQKNYFDAILTLNSLQSNRNIIETRDLDPNSLKKKLIKFKNQLKFLNIDQNDLTNLNVIHITGTKGKGSTCAFLESILREKNFKTGLYTSPHLTTVRERIKLNGKPIDEDLFTKYFWEIYNLLISDSIFKNDMPFYFSFLTLMAFYIFKKERVDVSIIEVGIGGEYDCTNVVDHPVVTGISSIGFDHIKLLGDTLKEIAWHKSGIFKQNVPSFITNVNNEDVMKVFLERMHEKKSYLKICHALEEYNINNKKIELGIDGEIQKFNASLAIQISNYFVNKLNNNIEQYDFNKDRNNLKTFSFNLDEETLKGLKNCDWPGRFQMIKCKNDVNFFLDGAHTVESINLCVEWFKNKCDTKKKSYNILIFNCTGDRLNTNLLHPVFLKNNFNTVLVSPILKHSKDDNNEFSDSFSMDKRKLGETLKIEKSLNELNFSGDVIVLDCLSTCIRWIDQKKKSLDVININVLVTGSIYLVGDVYSVLKDLKYV